MNSDDMIIGSWATLHGRCTARHTIDDADSVEFSFRNGSQSLDLAFDAQNLERFILLGITALREMKDLQPPSQG